MEGNDTSLAGKIKGAGTAAAVIASQAASNKITKLGTIKDAAKDELTERMRMEVISKLEKVRSACYL